MAQMEKCKFSTKRISFYIDGQLANKARLIVERHLSSCTHCQNETILLYNAMYYKKYGLGKGLFI
jgi:anti-sigma factor RsiW